MLCRVLQLINRLGRRRITIYSFLICGIACMLCAAVPAGEPGSINATLRICAAVMGKFGAAAAFALLFVFTTELFPTVVRNAALGANSAAARAGGVVAPLVVLLAAVMHAGSLSFAIFGLTSFLAGPPLPDPRLSRPTAHALCSQGIHTPAVCTRQARQRTVTPPAITHSLRLSLPPTPIRRGCVWTLALKLKSRVIRIRGLTARS